MRMQVRSLDSLSGLRIWHGREQWCRSQMWLGSWVAVAVAYTGSCSFDLTPSLGTSMCYGCGPKKLEKTTTTTTKKPKKCNTKQKTTTSDLSLSCNIFPNLSPIFCWDLLEKPRMFRCGVPWNVSSFRRVGKAQISLSFQWKNPPWPEEIKKKKSQHGYHPGSWRLDVQAQVMSQKGRVKIGRTLF